MEDFIVVETPAHLEKMTKEILKEAEFFKVQLKTDNSKLDADPKDLNEWFEEIVEAVTGKRYNWGYSDDILPVQIVAWLYVLSRLPRLAAGLLG